jgi:hypothetical protein
VTALLNSRCPCPSGRLSPLRALRRKPVIALETSPSTGPRCLPTG